MTRTIPLIAALLIAGPAFAQAPPTDPAQKAPTNQNIQPGTGGVSKAGKDGLPESKSGSCCGEAGRFRFDDDRSVRQ